MTVQRSIQVKEGKTWKQGAIYTDAAEVYKSLTEDLIAKKINSATYIRSIKRTQLYNGFQMITVYYSNNVKAEYTIECRA